MTSLRLLAVLDLLSGAPSRAKPLSPRPDGLIRLLVSHCKEKSEPEHPTAQGVAVARLMRLAIVFCLGATAVLGQAGNATLIRELEQRPDLTFVRTKQLSCKVQEIQAAPGPGVPIAYRLLG